MAESIPVFLLRSGLRLTLELERPEFCISTNHNVLSTGFTACDLVISNPYFELELQVDILDNLNLKI